MTTEFDQLTNSEWNGIGLLAESVEQSVPSIEKLLASVAKRGKKAKTYRKRSRKETRTALGKLYLAFIRASNNKNESKKVGGLTMGKVTQKKGGLFLNTLIATWMDVSKQRAYTLSLVVRRAVKEGVKPSEFASWLKGIKNMDKAANDYLVQLRRELQPPGSSTGPTEISDADVDRLLGRDEEYENSAVDSPPAGAKEEFRLGPSWKNLVPGVLKRARKKGKPRTVRVRIRCGLDGTIDFVERLNS